MSLALFRFKLMMHKLYMVRNVQIWLSSHSCGNYNYIDCERGYNPNKVIFYPILTPQSIIWMRLYLDGEVGWSSKRDEDEITYRRRRAVSLRAGGRKQGDVLLRKPEDIPFPNCPLNLVSDGSSDCWCAGKIKAEDSDWMECLECAHPKAWFVELCGLKWKVTTLIGRSQGPYTVVIKQWPWLCAIVSNSNLSKMIGLGNFKYCNQFQGLP